MNRETIASIQIAFYIIALIGIMFIGGCILISMGSIVAKEQNKYKAEIGKKLILEKDTLTIINFSSDMKNFTLSNGTIVNASLVFSKGGVQLK